jgi:hypothetical protein
MLRHDIRKLLSRRALRDSTWRREGLCEGVRLRTDRCRSASAEVMSVNTSAAFRATEPAQGWLHRPLPGFALRRNRDCVSACMFDEQCQQCCDDNAPIASRSGSPTVLPSAPAIRSPTIATIRLVERPGTFVFVTSIRSRDSGGITTGCGSAPIVKSTAPPATGIEH